MSSKNIREVTCDFCEKKVLTTDLDEVEGWFQVFHHTAVNGYMDFCSPECVCKQYQPAASALDEDWAF